MKRFLTVLISLMLILTISVALAGKSGADFGDFGGDYDYDYGDYDYDDYDDYDYDYYDDDDDWGFGFFSGGGGSNGSSTFGAILLLAIIIIVILFIKKKSSSQPTVTPHNTAPYRVPNDLKEMSSYQTEDPAFSSEKMREWIANAYVRLQKAWQAKDLAPVQTLLSDALYSQMAGQLESRYKAQGQTNIVDRIAVLQTTLLGWKREADKDVIMARLQTRVTDYVVNDADGRVVRGDPETEKFMTYEWTLIRSVGETTSEENGVKVQNCPNCGAPVDLNRAATCPYCGSLIKSEKHGWVISNIRGISQQTAGRS